MLKKTKKGKENNIYNFQVHSVFQTVSGLSEIVSSTCHGKKTNKNK